VLGDQQPPPPANPSLPPAAASVKLMAEAIVRRQIEPHPKSNGGDRNVELVSSHVWT
jgi:hypothetical protein